MCSIMKKHITSMKINTQSRIFYVNSLFGNFKYTFFYLIWLFKFKNVCVFVYMYNIYEVYIIHK